MLAEDKELRPEERKGIALCLSGGGFRATLFHLGALRRLNELGILPQLTSISSVSGGSVTSAYLAHSVEWPIAKPLDATAWGKFGDGLREFTRHDIRTLSILKAILPGVTGAGGLEGHYDDLLDSAKLTDLPNSPRFVFCSTDMSFGVNWIFEREITGSYQAGHCAPPPSSWTIGRAVAASSCFPPVFNPMPVNVDPSLLTGGRYPAGPQRDALIKNLQLTDGGVYDNLGLEPVWKDHAVVLVSDGGALFDVDAEEKLIWKLKRYVGIIENQAGALRKRWFISQCKTGQLIGTYWGIGSARSSYDQKDQTGYSKALATDVIAGIRTDFDRFSDAEAAVLQNHGYFMADKAVQTHVPHVVKTGAPPLQPPFPDWLDEVKVVNALADSGKTKWFGH